MAKNNGGLRKALGTGSADVILAELLKSGGAHHAGKNGGERQAERQGGKREVGEQVGQVAGRANAGNGQPSKPDGEDDDKQGAQSKVGKRQAEQRHNAEQAIGPGVATECGDEAGGNGEEDAEQERCCGEGEGVGVALQNELGDGGVKAEGLAQVEVGDTVPVAGVLLRERGVEAVAVAEGGDVGGGGAFAEHLHDGVAGHEVDKKKDDGDDDPKDGQGGKQATERVKGGDTTRGGRTRGVGGTHARSRVEDVTVSGRRSAAGRRSWTRTRVMRRPDMSSMV